MNRQQSLPASVNIAQSNSTQQNQFIPLQAARKSTKGKETLEGASSKSVQPEVKVKEVKKAVVDDKNVKPNTVMPQTAPQTQQRKTNGETSTAQDSRKSRLAIKF